MEKQKIFKCQVTWNDGSDHIDNIYFIAYEMAEAHRATMRNLDTICNPEYFVSILITLVEE